MPDDAANPLMPELSLHEKEVMVVLVLDTQNQLLAKRTVYKGSLNAPHVRVPELLQKAARMDAATVLVAYNHPSGDPTPSPEDVSVTRQMVDAGKLLDIEVPDHLCLGRGRWVSLRERGLGFN